MNLSNALAIAALAALASNAAAAIPHVATFDSDAENFQQSTTSSTVIWTGANGNPGGHLQLRKSLADPVFDLGTENMTSPEFLGNYGAASITGAGFDLNTLQTDLTGARIRFREAVTTNGWYYDFGAVAANDAWASYDAPLDPTWDDATAGANGWTQGSGAPSFADTFANVGWIEVRLLNPDDTSSLVDVDNVRITPTPSTLAIPALAALAATRRRR